MKKPYINFDRLIKRKSSKNTLKWEEVLLNQRVKRGHHWNRKWRQDIDKTSEEKIKPRLPGTIIGYIDQNQNLIGRNTNAKYDYDRLTTSPYWVAVKWDTGEESVYPVGYEGIYSLNKY